MMTYDIIPHHTKIALLLLQRKQPEIVQQAPAQFKINPEMPKETEKLEKVCF